MPEINFQLNLPDGKKKSLYSPSTVILEYLKPGDSLKNFRLQVSCNSSFAWGFRKSKSKIWFCMHQNFRRGRKNTQLDFQLWSWPTYFNIHNHVVILFLTSPPSSIFDSSKKQERLIFLLFLQYLQISCLQF